MKEAVAYTWASSQEQGERGFSIPTQRDRLAAYAQEKGLRVVAEFNDDEAAKTRPRGGRVRGDAPLPAGARRRAWCSSRSTPACPNLKDWITLDWLGVLGVELHLVAEGNLISPESHSPARFLHGIWVLMAKNYVEKPGRGRRGSNA